MMKPIAIEEFFLLCHYFAIMTPVAENESRHLGRNEMAGLKGKSGPPGNMNAFKHGYPEAAREKYHYRSRGERQAANSGRLDSRQRRG
jgi:hypothetical protein